MSLKDGPGDGTWAVFAEKVVAERDAAQSALVALRDAGALFDRLHFSGPGFGAPGDAEHTRNAVAAKHAWRAALAATSATLAGQVRARVLREAADLLLDQDGDWRPTVEWLHMLADEAERCAP